MRWPNHFIGLGVLLMGLAGGWVVFSQTIHPIQVEQPRLSEIGGTAALDGMTFSSDLGPLGKPADVKDTLIFANGTFLSTECYKQCGYPAAPYFVRRFGDKIEFVSESRCPNTDATLVWRGTVDNGSIKGRFHWKSSRWYWTIEKEFWFEGTRVKTAGPIAGSR